MYIMLTLGIRITVIITTIMKQNCEHCEYVWTSRVEEPKACPRCKRRFDYGGWCLEK